MAFRRFRQVVRAYALRILLLVPIFSAGAAYAQTPTSVAVMGIQSTPWPKPAVASAMRGLTGVGPAILGPADLRQALKKKGLSPAIVRREAGALRALRLVDKEGWLLAMEGNGSAVDAKLLRADGKEVASKSFALQGAEVPAPLGADVAAWAKKEILSAGGASAPGAAAAPTPKPSAPAPEAAPAEEGAFEFGMDFGGESEEGMDFGEDPAAQEGYEPLSEEELGEVDAGLSEGSAGAWPALRAGIGIASMRRQASLSKSDIEASNPFWPNLSGHVEVYPLLLAGSELSEHIQNIGVYLEAQAGRYSTDISVDGSGDFVASDAWRSRAGFGYRYDLGPALVGARLGAHYSDFRMIPRAALPAAQFLSFETGFWGEMPIPDFIEGLRASGLAQIHLRPGMGLNEAGRLGSLERSFGWDAALGGQLRYGIWHARLLGRIEGEAADFAGTTSLGVNPEVTDGTYKQSYLSFLLNLGVALDPK